MMFNDKYGLTEAVLNGKKTQTRRVFNEEIYGDLTIESNPVRLDEHQYGINSHSIRSHLPRYKVGEIVAIAQSYKSINENYFNNNDPMRFYYKQQTENLKGWNNKMFVKADLMPHQIQITKIRLERLQDISDEDCIAEGIDISPFDYGFWDKNKIRRSFSTPREAYASLIDMVSDKGTWKSNPYVFVYEFKLIK